MACKMMDLDGGPPSAEGLPPPPRLPPIVPGLPVLGSALALGAGGAAFLQQCRKEHGDAFTLRLLGQRMTFVFAPATLRHYFTAPDAQLTFAPAVQQFTHRVFGLPPRHFYSRHLHMLQASSRPQHSGSGSSKGCDSFLNICPLLDLASSRDTLRHELVPAELPRHTARLLHLLLARLRCWPAAGQLDLVAELKSLMFQASVAALFGPQFLGQKPGQGQAQVHPGSAAAAAAAGASSGRAEALQEAFFAFEAGFEMAASPLPHLFQPRFLAARRRLVAALRESYRAGHFEGTVAGSLIVACGLPEVYVPNMLLAVLWASQANAVPSSFWSVAFLLLPENQRHLQAVVAEAQQAVALLPGAAGAGAATAGAEAEAEAEARAGAALEGDGGAGELLTAAQQQGLVALAVDRRSYAAAAVGEALRLRSFSIDVRIAAADGVLPCGGEGAEGDSAGVWVQKGDVVAISPYQSHLDPRLYPEAPASYNPAREGMQLGAGGSAAQHSAAVPGAGGVPGLSFGGGKYRCPGRFFAEAELALVISLLLLLFDWQLLPREPPAAFPSSGGSGGGGGSSRSAGSQPSSSSQHDAAVSAPGDPAGLLPPPDLLKLVGIKVPAGPCWVQYRRRGSPPQQPA